MTCKGKGARKFAPVTPLSPYFIDIPEFLAAGRVILHDRF